MFEPSTIDNPDGFPWFGVVSDLHTAPSEAHIGVVWCGAQCQECMNMNIIF